MTVQHYAQQERQSLCFAHAITGAVTENIVTSGINSGTQGRGRTREIILGGLKWCRGGKSSKELI